jgi:hypothetical protein
MSDNWFSRPTAVLMPGLISLALGFFIEGRGWWNGVFGLVGVALLAAWVFPASRPWGEWMRERRWIDDRRRSAMPVGVERRQFERRAAA